MITSPTRVTHQITVTVIARGLALFLGLFSLLNLLAGLRNPGLDLNLWWIDLRPLPEWLSETLLALAALSLLAYAVGLRPRGIRPLVLSATAVLLVAALWNALAYYRLLHSGVLPSGSPFPFSLLVAAALGVIGVAVVRGGDSDLERRGKVLLVAVFLASAALFPVAQILLYGATDYRRPADVIVVLGAQAHADGTLSPALADRMRTACGLYHQGLAPRLILSGGPGDGPVHETEAMRRYALAHGIPEQAIFLDKGGVDTRATVTNTARLFPALHVHRVLAVSHSYHLPRIKLAYQQAGWEVYTVPVAHPRQPRSELAYMILRESVALWAYYLRLK